MNNSAVTTVNPFTVMGNENQYARHATHARKSMAVSREAQYILLVAASFWQPRALMYTALHKLNTGQVKKCIVAVPERTIGSSFKDTDLRSGGFHWDWHVNPVYNLCR